MVIACDTCIIAARRNTSAVKTADGRKQVVEGLVVGEEVVVVSANIEVITDM